MWKQQILAEIRDCQVFMMAMLLDPLVLCRLFQRRQTTPLSSGSRSCSILIAERRLVQPAAAEPLRRSSLRPPIASRTRTARYIVLARVLKTLPQAEAAAGPAADAAAAALLSDFGRITEQIDSVASLDHKEQKRAGERAAARRARPETSADVCKLAGQRMRKRDGTLLGAHRRRDRRAAGGSAYDRGQARGAEAEAVAARAAASETMVLKAELVPRELSLLSDKVGGQGERKESPWPARRTAAASARHWRLSLY